MKLFPNKMIVVSFGSLTITWYAVFIITGALLAYYISVKNFKKHNVDKELLSDFFVNVFVLGVIGARIWYVIFTYNEIFAGHSFLNVFKIYEGGLAIQGGVIVGVLYGIYFFKKHNISIFVAGDCIMPNVLIAQSFGRLGNFINQEAHGSQVTKAFLESLHLPNFIIDGMYINGHYYHPTFLYEIIGNMVVFLIIILIIKRFVKIDGVAFLSYFIGYGVVRFFIEGLRTDSLMVFGFRTAQLTSIAFIVVGFLGIGYLYFTNRNEKIINQETGE